jgi:DNA-binding transcriptional regulator YdaS (Cro superfamily)
MTKKTARPHILMHAAQKLGGMAQLAAELGIARQAVYQWTKIPIERVADIERLTNIPRAELRPDIFGDAQ